MDPSSNVCNILNTKLLMKISNLTWLHSGLGPANRWSHRHGATIDNYTRIYRYWTLQRKVIGTFRLKQFSMYGPQQQCVQYF